MDHTVTGAFPGISASAMTNTDILTVQMLESRTDIAGSLGMGDDPSAAYNVIGVGKNGKTSLFLEVRSKV
ncbi:hypothetical protein HW571_18920 [Agrobacterium genomosp. 3]|jgi:hypothetical protein|uniref:hypothetical protein n=1 Tax=Agrobacterium tomkonis TaxID=1183410 RepID=UPI00021707EE|nr:hypothetical protein Agau_P200337 [Agrobacterium tumefaciens F2]MCA1867755.1 hypothetical protein [Agrobacterium tomkonis]MCA1878082.1 hypothetical protein [Agrobacterium tumefaciens]MCA1893307.1 hypothetical protein [Agrobacterium tomkonis]